MAEQQDYLEFLID
jgi:hypothetical protein